jgi:uncharacterized membrane protein YeaQ/YmgE (transglycosylase-associated protein family)
MTLIWMVLVGLIVGIVAKLLMPGRDPGGIVVTSLLGIAGAVIAGWAGRAAGMYAEGQPAGFIASTLGAIILLAIYRALTGGGGRTGAGRFDRAA